jgi:hypothetical protein
MRLRPLVLSLLAVLTICPPSELIAQTTASGALAGVVTDPSHAVVADANVEIKDFAKNASQSTRTDAEGVYRFFFLAPGKYVLRITHAGFREERRTVDVLLGPPVSLNVTLEIATSSTSTTVTGEAPLVQAESGDVSVTMNQKQVSEVPNPGNDLTYIAQTAPGVVMNTDNGGAGYLAKFSILGMPGYSYAFTVDGISITDNYLNAVRGGPLGLTLGANQTEEATVVTSAYLGQFGGAAGGNINYVTKSGGNAFHGNAQYYWNGTSLNANDWFNKAFGNPRPLSIANQWAGSLGGPIRKDKLFFFFDTEGLRLVIPQVLFTLIPTPEFEAATIANIDSELDSNGQLRFGPGSATEQFYRRIFDLYDNTPGADRAVNGAFGDPLVCTGFQDKQTGLGITKACARNFTTTRSRPSQDTLTSGRVDWNVGENDRAFFRVQEEGGVAATSDDPIDSVFDSELDNWRWQGQMLETHTFGPATASQFLVGVSDHYWSYRPSHPVQSLAAFPTVLNFWTTGTFTSLGGLNQNGSCSLDTRTLQISEDLVTTRGSHKLGFGVSMDREYGLEDCIFNRIGQLFPQTLRAFYEGGFDPASKNIDFTSLQQGFAAQPKTYVRYGGIQGYVQDEWRARPNLTFTFALRAEHRINFWCENYCFSHLVAPFEEISHDPNQPYDQVLVTNQKHALQSFDRINWSPRFGFAWQPLGVSHGSVLRGGVGILYDPPQETLAENLWQNPPKYTAFTAFGNNLTPGEASNLFEDAKNSNEAFLQGYKTGETFAQLQKDIPNLVPPSLTSTESKMHRPQYQKWSLEWQQALGLKTSVSVGYFGHHGIHELVQNPNANAYGFGSLPAGQCSSPPVLPCSDPRFAGVDQVATTAVSNYNGMVASFRHQFSGWGSGLVQVNYTYGHALDEVSNGGALSFTTGSSLSPQDPSNLRGAYGPAEYDVRHSMNANYVWELPLKSLLQGHGPNALLKGWQVSGTFFARTGFPYTVFDFAKSGSLQQNNYFGVIYSVPVGPLPKGSTCVRVAAFGAELPSCLPPQFFVQPDDSTVANPNALFIQATCETGFNTGHLPSATDPTDLCGGPLVSFAQGRNRFRSPSYFNADLAIMKSTPIPGWEGGSLALGFQFFNVLNHPNFGTPVDASSDPAYGLIVYGEQVPTGILGSGNNGSGRMVQLKAELRF